jgi:thioredoxin 1
MTVKLATDDNFKMGIRGQGITIADFTAPWCAPCKPLLQILDELDAEYDGAVEILKLNVDESPASAAEFGVMSMPTVILFKDGVPVEKLVGLRPKEAYRNIIAKYVS